MVVTPAHLLVLPVDNKKLFNFMNFDNIGARTSVKSNAFAQIRRASKTYTTNLVHTPSVFLAKYKQINALFENETKYADSLNYGLKRQHNLTASAATTSNNSNFLDRAGMESFLDHTLKFSPQTSKTEGFDRDLNLGLPFETTTTTVQDSTRPSMFNSLRRSDAGIVNKLNSLTDSGRVKRTTTLAEIAAAANTPDLVAQSQSSKTSFQVASEDELLLTSEQSVRPMVEEGRAENPLHTAGQKTAIDSNIEGLSYTSAGDDILPQTNFSQIKHNDSTSVLALTTNRLYNEAPHTPIISNNPQLSNRHFDGYSSKATEVTSSKTQINKVYKKTDSEVINVLKAKESSAPSIFKSY